MPSTLGPCSAHHPVPLHQHALFAALPRAQAAEPLPAPTMFPHLHCVVAARVLRKGLRGPIDGELPLHVQKKMEIWLFLIQRLLLKWKVVGILT